MNPIDELKKQLADGLRAEAIKARGLQQLEEIIREHCDQWTTNDIMRAIAQRVG